MTTELTGDRENEFNHEEVMSPGFLLEHDADSPASCKNLYLQTFRRSPDKPDMWVERPVNEWHLLAHMYPGEIVMYPIYANPHAQRYLSPKNGRFERIIYQDNNGEKLPDSAEEAVWKIEMRLSGDVFDECSYGLGLSKNLDAVWRGLSSLPNVDTLTITNNGPTQVIGRIVWVTTRDLDQLRRAFARAKRAGRERVKLASRVHVRNNLLARLNPERFPPIVQVSATGQLVEFRLDRSRPSSAVARSARRSSVRAVRENLQSLVSEAPCDLLELHAEIERVTLANMVERYESMLRQSLSESKWQRFFESNIFILTMIFARPVHLLHTQFHAQGSSLNGSGAQVGDFLFAEKGQSLAIVEIKKPASVLMLNTPYRNTEVYGPTADLSGAVTQVLYQQSMLHSNWLVHRVQPTLRESFPDATKCVVIAGTMPDEEAQCRSFELFRNACKNVEVVTFDELLGKLQLLLTHLTPRDAAANDRIPF